MRRRRSRSPFQSVGLPRIALGLLAGEQARDKIIQEKNLRRAEDQCAHRDKNIPVLHRLEKLVLSRVVNPPHMTGHSEEMHREKGAVKENVGQHEVDLPQPFVHHPTEHLRKPVIDRGE